MITVFYDGKCGLCRREIEHYKRIASVGIFEWVDITITPEIFTALGFTVSDGLRALHLRDASGKMHIGVDGFIVIWQKLPYWWMLGKCARLPFIHPLAYFLYEKFAAWRFKKLGYDSCKIGEK
jgi:predicted DCC family thiol-disulfide oxidoreductase YuxK